MATSSVPANKIELHRSLKKPLTKGVTLDRSGRMTSISNAAHTLMSLGGSHFGYKGAGLAGYSRKFFRCIDGHEA